MGGATGAVGAAATASAGAGADISALAEAGAGDAGLAAGWGAGAAGVLTTPSVLLATNWRSDAAAIGSTDDDATLLATPMEFNISKTSRGLTDNSFAIS